MSEPDRRAQRIAGLSEAQRRLLERRLGGGAADRSAASRITPRTGAGPAPLSIMQERVWLMDQLGPASPSFNLPAAFRLTFALDPVALQRSLDALVERHPPLRTRFVLLDGAPAQIVERAARVELPVVDLSASRDREAEARRLASEEARRPFDLAVAPLIRARLVRLGPQDHVFTLVVHHIVADAWSMDLLFRELTALYQGFAAGRRTALPQRPLQYADYAAWERSWLVGSVLQGHLDYWKARLAGAPVLVLQTDHPRPAAPTFGGARVPVALPARLATALRELSRRHGVTLFMTLLAGFKALLSRHTGQHDIVVGSHTANRTRVELEGLVGFFVNTLILRTDLGGDPSFLELLHRVEDTALGAYAHQELPFTRIEELLADARDGRGPLFQVVFQLLNLPASDGGDASGVRRLDVSSGSSTFELAVNLAEEAGEIRGTIEYSTDLFEADTIERLAAQYRRLLEGVVAQPEQRISQLPLLSAEQRRHILVERNATDRELPAGDVVEVFERCCALRPGATAFRCEGRALSYAELHRQSRAVAAALRREGVGPGCVVGICVERSLELPVALLGVLQAGAAFLPLDPSYPRARLVYMLRDAGAPMAITRRALAPLVTEAGARPLLLEEVAELPAPDADELRGSRAPDDLAYVLYTSGSTGVPKGVAAPHRQLWNRLWWMWRDYPFAPGETAAQMTAFSFIDSIWELLGPLLQGVPTEIVPPHVVRDAHALVARLAEARVTRVWVVPALLRALIDVVPDLGERLPALRFWVSSGEALSPELVQAFHHRLPDATLYNLYGTSEVWDATWYRTSASDGARQRVPIGRPIDNLRALVLDATLEPVPDGVPGELFIGGAGVAHGYLGNDELTAQRFLADPWVPGARLYRTGDLARFLADGTLEHLGRADQQIKLRGYRIEPSEVEALLAPAPGVRQAVVAARQGAAGEQQLVAYLVRDGSGDSSLDLEAEPRRRAEHGLPEYMRPGTYVVLDALPLTPSGKVDRRALPEPASLRRRLSRGYVAPGTPTEQELAQIWSTLLGVERVGARDHFFTELGGQSLLGIRAVSRIRDSFGIELSLRQLFDAPTVAALGAVIDGLPREPPRPSSAVVPVLDRERYRIQLPAVEDA